MHVGAMILSFILGLLRARRRPVRPMEQIARLSIDSWSTGKRLPFSPSALRAFVPGRSLLQGIHGLW